MTQTTEQSWWPKEASKNEAQGVPELTPNDPEFIEKDTGIIQIPKKMKLPEATF